MASVEERLSALEEKSEKYDAIANALASVDSHRNRAVREVFDAVKVIVRGEPDFSIEVVEPNDQDETKRPSLNGPGSSTNAWLEYAHLVGVEVPEGASKAQIVEAVEAAEDSEDSDEIDESEADEDPAGED